MTFRVFTNDRGRRAGVALYSGLAPVTAPDLRSAQAAAEERWPQFGPPDFAPLKAVEWPPATPASKRWVNRHVGGLPKFHAEGYSRVTEGVEMREEGFYWVHDAMTGADYIALWRAGIWW